MNLKIRSVTHKIQMDTPNFFKIGYNVTLGRHLIATKNIKLGDVILKESPLVRGPFLQTAPVCLICGKILTESSQTPCIDCGWPLCSKNCFKTPSAKSVHEAECRMTQNKGSKICISTFGVTHPNYQSITILRCLNLKLSNPENWAKVIQLEGDHERIDENEKFITSYMRKFYKLQDTFTDEEILKIYGIITINGHELPLCDPPQVAIYESTSMLEHNCKANCAKTFTNEGEILIIAAENIAEGEHLSICYTDPLWGTINRRNHLKATKNFLCCCVRCSDPTEFQTYFNSLKCQKENCCGYIQPISFLNQTSQWSCSNCAEIVPINLIGDILREIQKKSSTTKKSSIVECQKCINQSVKVLAPNHFSIIDCKITLVQILANRKVRDLSDKDLDLKIRLSKDLLEVVLKIAPAETRLKGILLYELVVAKLDSNRRRNPSKDEFNSELKTIKELLEECCCVLQNEPSLFREGELYKKATVELKEVEKMLK